MDRPRRSARASNAPQLGYPAPSFTTQPPPQPRIPSSTSSSRLSLSNNNNTPSSSTLASNQGQTIFNNGSINGTSHGSTSSFQYGVPPVNVFDGMGNSTPPMGARNGSAAFPISKSLAPIPPHIRVGPGQARHTTFASRARLGVSTLMQPLPTGPDLQDPLKMMGSGMDYGTTERTRGGVTRRRAAAGMTYYGEEGSDFEDDDDAEENGAASPSKGTTPVVEEEDDKAGALLGLPPPGNKIQSKRAHRTHPLYASEGDLLDQAERKEFLIPIKIELETDTHRIKDVFSWNMREAIVKPKDFARVFVRDLELPPDPFTALIEQAILSQINLAEQSGIDLVDIEPASGGPFAAKTKEQLNRDSRSWNWGIKRKRDKRKEEVDESKRALTKWDTEGPDGDFEDDLRVIVDYDVQIYKHHLRDRLEWDLCSPLTPEAFANQVAKDLCLSGEALPIISNAVREQLLNHQRSAIELELIGKGLEYARWQQEIEDAEKEEMENFKRRRRGLPILPLKPLQMMQEEQEEEEEVLGPRRKRQVGTDDPASSQQEESRVATPTPKTNVILRTPAQRKGIAEFFQHQLTEKGPRRLENVWRDYYDSREFGPLIEMLTEEDLERIEQEAIRASRRGRRDQQRNRRRR